jgi:hypothetical protein
MSSPLWVIVVTVAVVVIVGLLLMARGGGRPRLRALRPEARDRYAASWRAVEARFIDQPMDAVREADRLVQEMLRERGLMLERRTPDRLKKARSAAQARDGRSTEGLRQAMLHYRAIVVDGVGREAKRSEAGRREVA